LLTLCDVEAEPLRHCGGHGEKHERQACWLGPALLADRNYYQCWVGLKSHFDPDWAPGKAAALQQPPADAVKAAAAGDAEQHPAVDKQVNGKS
jgi:hypothetical protein